MPRGVPGSAIKTKNGDKRHNLTRYMMNVMASATKADLDIIDIKIQELEADLKGLKALRECFAERVLNLPAATITEDQEQIRTKIAQYLRFQGPTTAAAIKRQFDLDAEETQELLSDERFEIKHNVWRLSSKGEAFMEGLKT